jgi:hypothetical protein
MSTWSPFEKGLAVVAALVFVGVAVLGVVAWRSGGDDEGAVPEGCDGATLDSELTSDDGPIDALRHFVQARPEAFPVDDSWVLESDDAGAYVFVSDSGGRFEVEVRRGLVRRYLSCPD